MTKKQIETRLQVYQNATVVADDCSWLINHGGLPDEVKKMLEVMLGNVLDIRQLVADEGRH